MVLFWYLTRQLLGTTLGLVLVLTVVITTGRFIQYLSDAATGEMAANILFAALAYRLPGFMDIVLPLSLFIAVLLVYGRLYADSEMVVIHACGISPGKVMAYTLAPGLLVMAVLAAFTLVITPASLARSERLLNDPDNAWGINTLVPGRFQRTKTGDKANYTESMVPGDGTLQRLFVASRGRDSEGRPTQSITVALTGRVVQDESSATRYLELTDGVRYEGWPGQRDFSVATFHAFGQQLEKKQSSARVRISSDAKPTWALLGSDKAWDMASLHWRLSLPFVIPVSILLALPLARTNPRQGRWLKLLPALLLFLLYLVLLIAMRDSIANTRLQGVMPLWNMHLVFVSVAVGVMLAGQWSQRRSLQAMQRGDKVAP